MNVEEKCLLYNKKIIEAGLAVDKFGNAGIRKGKNLYVKPSGVNLESIDTCDVSIVEIETGKLVHGLKPSSDTPTYLEILRNFPEVNSIIHTHSLHATAWSQSLRPVPCFGTTHADYWKDEIPITRELTRSEILTDYEKACGRVIIERINEMEIEILHCPGVLLRSHGPFVWGESIEIAYRNAVLIEYISEMALKSLSLNHKLDSIHGDLQDKHFTRKHGSNSYYGQ